MEYTWNASFCPFVFWCPKSWIVVGFGVAVKANIDTLACLPFRLISLEIISSTSASVSSPDPSVIVIAAISLPAVEECASSMMTANRLFFKLATLSTIYGNFWIVVAIIFVLPFSAIARSADTHLSSITRMSPALCSIPMIAFCSCLSTTTRSVTITTLSKIILLWASCSEVNRCASHAIELVFPEPALCWIR